MAWEVFFGGVAGTGASRTSGWDFRTTTALAVVGCARAFPGSPGFPPMRIGRASRRVFNALIPAFAE